MGSGDVQKILTVIWIGFKENVLKFYSSDLVLLEPYMSYLQEEHPNRLMVLSDKIHRSLLFCICCLIQSFSGIWSLVGLCLLTAGSFVISLLGPLFNPELRLLSVPSLTHSYSVFSWHSGFLLTLEK